jgi:ubiquinone/menaquinone biosynthesis C-methylase UbiE
MLPPDSLPESSAAAPQPAATASSPHTEPGEVVTTAVNIEATKLIEVDDGDGDESAYGSSLGSSTQSVSSSVRDYVYENGRRYHRYSEGKYLLPNDESEQDRLDLYHFIHITVLNGKLHLADIGDSPHNILDCGTGTGIWALDMAEVFPSAQVIGVDLSPIQPEWVLPNCKFEVDDLELDWTYKKNYFDYIHSRDVGNCIKDWPRYAMQMFRHCKPGGCVEISEMDFKILADDSTLEGTNIRTFFEHFHECSVKAGFKYPNDQSLAAVLRNAGFEDVKIYAFKQPWGPWPKDPTMKKIGHMVRMAAQTGFEAYGMALLTRYGGFNTESAGTICRLGAADLDNKSIHSYMMSINITGRKPLKQS